jgi:hypothetical protein
VPLIDARRIGWQPKHHVADLHPAESERGGQSDGREQEDARHPVGSRVRGSRKGEHLGLDVWRRANEGSCLDGEHEFRGSNGLSDMAHGVIGDVNE